MKIFTCDSKCHQTPWVSFLMEIKSAQNTKNNYHMEGNLSTANKETMGNNFQIFDSWKQGCDYFS